MIKSELVKRMCAAHPGLFRHNAEKIVNAIFAELTEALARGDRVEMRGFGSFSLKTRRARSGRNPRTGEPVAVRAKTVPRFKMSKEMGERLNKAS